LGLGQIFEKKQNQNLLFSMKTSRLAVAISIWLGSVLLTVPLPAADRYHFLKEIPVGGEGLFINRFSGPPALCQSWQQSGGD